MTPLLLLQKGSSYPEAHPLSQCPVVELQGPLCRQCPLHLLLQPLPNVPISQPVSNYNKFYITYNKRLLKGNFNYNFALDIFLVID